MADPRRIAAATRYRLDHALPPKAQLPTMFDLPSELPGEPGLPDEFHLHQPRLLRETFEPTTVPYDQVFVATDLNLYYDPFHTEWYKRPDWFAVIGNSRLYEGNQLRYSYVVWQEEVSPFLVLELLSPGTEREDLGRTLRDPAQPPTKWQVYERILAIPYYVVYRQFDPEPRIFKLEQGRYRRVQPVDQPYWFEDLGLGLGTWTGTFEGCPHTWLRWFDASGEPIPTTLERTAAERSRADAARLQADAARLQADAARLQADAERSRAEAALRQAEAERLRADEERASAEAERKRADAAERRLAELEARLGVALPADFATPAKDR